MCYATVWTILVGFGETAPLRGKREIKIGVVKLSFSRVVTIKHADQ